MYFIGSNRIIRIVEEVLIIYYMTAQAQVHPLKPRAWLHLGLAIRTHILI